MYRNAARAVIGELRAISSNGVDVAPRGIATRELLSRTVQLARPSERCITLPGRRNSVVGAITETMWVMAGRDDMEFLKNYVPRAPLYSDDGVRWRAAYGPRLRNWNGIDQVDQVRRVLLEDSASRRAVIAIFDPDRDFVESKDIPCNNWLHFLCRGDRLDMNIVVRSNDVLWGFSGINTFEWSVLHEAMAHWLGKTVGTATYFISSLHLYLERADQADRVLGLYAGKTGYEDGYAASPIATPWSSWDETLRSWFEIESAVRDGRDARQDIEAFPDPLLREFLQAIEIHWAAERGTSGEELRTLISKLGSSDVAYALHEHYFRDTAELPRIGPPSDAEADGRALHEAIRQLHRKKDESYRDAWKKRGEMLSVVTNVARKVDRIQTVSTGANAHDESLLDTAVDLLVYAVKYKTFLADIDQSTRSLIARPNLDIALSDGPSGFELLWTEIKIRVEVSDGLDAYAAAIVGEFEGLSEFLQEPENQTDYAGRLVRIDRLIELSSCLVGSLAFADPDGVEAFISDATR